MVDLDRRRVIRMRMPGNENIAKNLDRDATSIPAPRHAVQYCQNAMQVGVYT